MADSKLCHWTPEQIAEFQAAFANSEIRHWTPERLAQFQTAFESFMEGHFADFTTAFRAAKAPPLKTATIVKPKRI